jgi:hypothetical protein
MNNDKITLMKERINEQIKKIDNKDFAFYFYVIDTKGVASGSLSYIYDIALNLKKMGYNVGMMHSEEEFIGVEEWLGKEYADLPHYNVEKKSVEVGPSDILFIPEMFSNVMSATKKLPCMRVAILQSFEKMCEFIPFGATWGDLGIHYAITNTNANEKRLKSYFPFIQSHVIHPKIDGVFNDNGETKKLMVNIVSRNPGDINQIVKPFFWHYPLYQWVAFRELRGLSRQEFADALNEAAITVWVDNSTNFGYTALEAMKCGSIVIGKTPDSIPEWMWDDKDGVDDFSNAGIWVDSFERLPDILASVIRTWTMDSIPVGIKEEGQNLAKQYTEGRQLQDIKNVIIDGLVQQRREDFVKTLESLNNSEN